eukprot:CAMPEP_0119329940 /NCGR_PEP_ID=MMETSP1333-20130426/77101_1 /TAXON_ID=418940 /ORGANISM="Scyphosphaera apsteinii, Strain RCC1455" /LENGTH=46 /DNA_ID= /DNA_START= /DNA_END= /DNA_ORIENTATION=
MTQMQGEMGPSIVSPLTVYEWNENDFCNHGSISSEPDKMPQRNGKE